MKKVTGGSTTSQISCADQLPDDLKELALRYGLDVRHASFRSDMDKLIRCLKAATIRGNAMRADGRIRVEAAIVQNSNGKWFKSGAGKTEWFKDHEHGPEMVVVPGGSFVMGSPESEHERVAQTETIERDGTECPRRTVTIARPFSVGRHPITRRQFSAFVNDTGYVTGAEEWRRHVPKWKASWRNPGFAQ